MSYNNTNQIQKYVRSNRTYLELDNYDIKEKQTEIGEWEVLAP